MSLSRRQPGRKSAGAATTPAVFGVTVPRLPPPGELDFEQKEVWALVTGSMPAGWFSPAATPLLVQLCRHTVQARRIGELIERAAGDPKTELAYYQSLLAAQARETAAICSVSTKLRISVSSVRDNRGNAHHSRPNPAPWDDP